MRLGPIIIATVGIVIAGGSVYYAQGMMPPAAASAVAQPRTPAIETAAVWVAARDLPLGASVTRDDLKSVDWPAKAVPKGAMTDVALILGKQDNPQSRRTRQPFVAGELMLNAKLGDFGEDVSLIQKLGANTRAVAIKVDAVTAVGGFVSPGDFVDIVLTQGNGADLRAGTILQAIRVIGVDQSVNASGEANVARTITVEVTPNQGQKLALAQRAGTLSLTLRTRDAAVDQTLSQITLNDLLGAPEIAPAPVAPRAAPARTVRERRGASDSNLVKVD